MSMGCKHGLSSYACALCAPAAIEGLREELAKVQRRMLDVMEERDTALEAMTAELDAAIRERDEARNLLSHERPKVQASREEIGRLTAERDAERARAEEWKALHAAEVEHANKHWRRAEEAEARAERYRTALDVCVAELECIANRTCTGTYGPCGDANTSAYQAEDALEIARAALKEVESK